MRFPRPDLDLRDLHVYGGLTLAALGGWQISPTATCILIGVVLTAIGIFVPRKGS